MNLKEMGEAYRRERERLGLTIDEVVQKTKISKSNILALEAGDPEGLPHPVYAKGFARNYARLLKLDPEECAAAMGREFVVADNVAPEAPDEGETETPVSVVPAPGKGLKIVLLALALVTVIGGAAVFMFTGKDEQPAPEAPAVTAPAPAEAPEAPADVQTPNMPQDMPQDLSEAEQDEAAPAEPQAAAPVESESAPAVPYEGLAVQSEPEPVVAPAHLAEFAEDEADGDRERVVITAREACWILAQVDGGDDVDGGVTVDVMLQPGQSKLLRFHKTLVAKLGNGGGVDVTLNGRHYDFAAQSGQVKTLTFDAP